MSEHPHKGGPGPEGGASAAVDSIVLEEEIDPNYVPSEAEVVEYAKWLGMDLKNDQDLFWVAKEGLMAPLPKNWKPCKTKDTEDIYYFNFSTGDSTWDHPCDGYYKRLYEEEKKKKEVQMKESSDQVRTRAKQDVDQLLGKGEKKRRKKSTDTIDSLTAASATKMMAGSGVTSLGPLSTLEKKPLPGIQSLTVISSKEMASLPPKRDLLAATSNDSRLSSTQNSGDANLSRSSSSSSASGAISGFGVGQVAALPASSIVRESTPSSSAEFEPSDSKNPKSKKSSRLSSVIAESDDQSKIDSPQRSSEFMMEAKVDDLGSSRFAQATEAKSQPLSSVGNVAAPLTSAGNSLQLDAKNDNLIAKLRLQVRRLEGDCDIKTRQCDRFEAENADLERRLVKEKMSAKEMQESHEERELKLQKQIKGLKEEVAQLDKQVEEAITQERQLRATNRDLMFKNEQLKSSGAVAEGSVGASGAEASTLHFAELQEEISKLEEAKRRAHTVSADLREQLVAQEATHKEKLASTIDELERVQKSLDDVRQDCDALNKRALFEKESAAAINSVVTAAPSSQTAVEKADKVVVLPDDNAFQAAQQLQQLTTELSNTKIERDDMINKSKRLELLISSWESDCKDKETRLQLARTSCNELDAELTPLKTSFRQSVIDLANALDKARLLEMERDSLKAEQMCLQEKLREWLTSTKATTDSTSHRHDQAAENEKKELQSALEAEKALNQLSEKKMRGFQEELIQLQRRLQEVKDGQVAAENAATGKLSSELQDVKALLRTADKKILALSAEVDSHNQRTLALTERNAVLQAEADRLREIISTNKATLGSSSSSVSKVDKELDALLLLKEDELSRNNEFIFSLKSQIADLQAKSKSEKLIADKLLTDNADLTAALNMKDATCRDAEASVARIKKEMVLAERTAELTIMETNQLRKDGEAERKLRMKLEKEFAELKASHYNADGIDSEAASSRFVRMYHGEGSIVELSIIVGKQQAMVAQLEGKLQEAETKIKDMDVRPNHESPVPLKVDSAAIANAVTSVPPLNTQRPFCLEDKAGTGDVDLDQSLLREMMLDFVRRRRPFLDANERSPYQSVMNWNAKILKEKKFILEARKRLKNEKVAIRLQQNGLLKRREAWKKSRNDPFIGGVALTKDVAHQLNRQTLQLNLAIEQAKRTQQWLDEREHKLDRLEDLVESSASNEDNEELAELDGLGKELDTDATMIELEPFLPLQPSFQSACTQYGIYNQENHFPDPQIFFPEDAVTKETNTYLQSKKEEKVRSAASGCGASAPRPAFHPSAPETFSMHAESANDRRLMQLKIQREVEERTKAVHAFHDHAGWLDGLRSEIAGEFHTCLLTSIRFIRFL